MITNKRNLFILIFKCCLFAVLVGVFCVHVMPQYEHGYNAALIDKVDRLKSIEGPKIVLLSNSNVAFGFNSQMIEEHFGMPVVNMGLHGGLGNAFHEEMAKINVTPGDIYIICHSSYSDTDDIEDPALAWITIEDHLELWRLIRPKDIYSMLKAYPAYLNKVLQSWSNGTGNALQKDTPYSREAFNEYGDVVYDRTDGFRISDEKAPEVNETCTNRINALNKYLQERGARLVIAGYPIIVNQEASGKLKKQLTQFEQELKTQCMCDVISDYQDYCYDRAYFYGTTLHLNNDGALLRTEQLIHDLEQYLQQEK